MRTKKPEMTFNAFVVTITNNNNTNNNIRRVIKIAKTRGKSENRIKRKVSETAYAKKL